MAAEEPKTRKVPSRVERTSVIAEVLEARPDAGRVLREVFKLPCEECIVSEAETIEEGARYYGHDADEIVARLNACPAKDEPKPGA